MQFLKACRVIRSLRFERLQSSERRGDVLVVRPGGIFGEPHRLVSQGVDLALVGRFTWASGFAPMDDGTLPTVSRHATVAAVASRMAMPALRPIFGPCRARRRSPKSQPSWAIRPAPACCAPCSAGGR